MPVMQIAFTMYPVSDMARSVAFYEGTLGLKKSGLESETWTEFDIAGACFGIGAFEQVGTPGSAQSLALEVDDMVAYRAELKGKGVESSDPFETPICFISMLSDPDGNKVCLHQLKHSH